jgi:hypothetical protein
MSLAVVEKVVEAGCNAAGPTVGDACTFVIDHLQAIFDLVGQGIQPTLICTKFGFCPALNYTASLCIVKYFQDASCTVLGGGPPGNCITACTECALDQFLHPARALCVLCEVHDIVSVYRMWYHTRTPPGLLSNPFEAPVNRCVQLLSAGFAIKAVTATASVATVQLYPAGCGGPAGQLISTPLNSCQSNDGVFSVSTCL